MWKAWRSVPTRTVKISEEANLCRLIQHSLGGQVNFAIGAITCQKESEGLVWEPFLGSFERQQELWRYQYLAGHEKRGLRWS